MQNVAKTLNIEKAKQQHRLRRDAQLLLCGVQIWKFEKVRFGKSGDTPPKTNMEPKFEGLEDDFPFQRGDF